MSDASRSRTEALEPAMEVIAIGHSERSDLYDPSPELDSVLEFLLALPRDTPDRAAAITWTSRALAKNELQISHGRTIAGYADELTRDHHDAECNGGATTLGIQAIARALRIPLATIAEPTARTSADERLDAFAAIHAVVTAVPRAQLLSDGVRYELGIAKSAVLERIVNVEGVAGSAPATPEVPRGGVERAEF